MRTFLVFSLTAIVCFFSASTFAQSISVTASHDTICVGSSVTFSATASGTGTPHYQWYKNGVSVGTDSTGYTTNALNNGDVIICLLSSSVSGPTIAVSSGIVMVVYHYPAVSAIFGTDSVCRNATVILTNDSTGGAWSSSNTAIANVNAAGHVAGVAAGFDTITYTITNFCGTASASLTIKVKTNPVVLSVVGPAHICTGTPSSLYTDSTPSGTWGSSNTAVATVDTAGYVTPLTPGNINITYALTNNCGTTTRTRAIVVSSPPVPGPITGSTTVCQSDTVHLHNPAPGGTWISSDPNSALISVSGGGPGGTYGLLAGIMPGTDTITYIVVNFCGTDTNSVVVTVNPLPVVYPIGGNDSLCPGASFNLTEIATGGTWASSNTSIATIDANGLLTGVANGTADITYSLTNSCGTTTQTLSIAVYCPLAVNNIELNSNITISPNPAHDIIYIGGFKPAAIHIVNMYGQIVKEASNTNNIHISELSAGIYFVQLYNANGIIVSKQRIVKL